MAIIEFTNKTVRAYYLNGIRYPVEQWNEVLFGVIDFLFKRHETKLLEYAKNEELRGIKGWIYLTLDKSRISGDPHEIKPGMFVEKKMGATFLVYHSGKFLQKFGYNDFKIETDDGEITTILPERDSIGPLAPGDTITNETLCEIFKCSTQGGMRRSKTTSSLVLVSDHVDPIYGDRWIGNTFHYTGEGLEGDQELKKQNKTLFESKENEVSIHLFEKFEKNAYTYIGEVQLAGDPYREFQPDINGKSRKTWIFPIRIKSGDDSPPLPLDIITKQQQKKEKIARVLSMKELREKIENSIKIPGVRNTKTRIYERNAYVAEYAKKRANGICDLCGYQAPFIDKDGDPYLETHHIVWLAKGGEDTIENTSALCPNCHKKMHILNDNADIRTLKKKIRNI